MSNYLTENLRTVALVGHSASGKTSLVEAMLVRTGAIAEAGSVERGNTVCDNDPQEKAVGHSLRMAVAHIDTAMPDLTPVRIHVIDTPGGPDYVGPGTVRSRCRQVRCRGGRCHQGHRTDDAPHDAMG